MNGLMLWLAAQRSQENSSFHSLSGVYLKFCSRTYLTRSHNVVAESLWVTVRNRAASLKLLRSISYCAQSDTGSLYQDRVRAASDGCPLARLLPAATRITSL